MRLPVVLRVKPRYRPPAALFYEVASNGLFQVRETVLYRAVTRAETGVPGLLPASETLELRLPPLPAALLAEVLAFFREAHRRYGGEAIVILFHRPEDGRYEVGVPPQTIPGYHDSQGVFRAYHQLHYGYVARPPGFVRLGTIHSHGRLPAYASSTDCADEQWEDGLHVVLGELERDPPSRAASFVANGVRFELEPDDVLEPCGPATPPAPQAWMERLHPECAPAIGRPVTVLPTRGSPHRSQEEAGDVEP